ncbi:hypothetical protein [Archangium violaceum]|uniref:hypothetical protein n=1 Tax=Archangium violaceum TaxID=83451 RepID=UPI0037C062D7
MSDVPVEQIIKLREEHQALTRAIHTQGEVSCERRGASAAHGLPANIHELPLEESCLKTLPWHAPVS